MKRSDVRGDPPILPLLLWETPPGLAMILAQEGIAFETIQRLDDQTRRRGRFVLFDGRRRRIDADAIDCTKHHVCIDIDDFRAGASADPFEAIVDLSAARGAWAWGTLRLVERVARHDKGALRVRLLRRLRHAVIRAGGLWARIAPYPRPFRSAFNFRADLDEPFAADYFRFARARAPLDDCATHFVSTAAYGHDPAVLDSLRGLDVQSHGHFHHVYRDLGSNRRNLERSRDLLRRAGFDPNGFAAPGGRWNRGLDAVLEEGGYAYSSDFSTGYDDFPFFPWLGDRFSKVLQVPIHPVCEGLFVEAGCRDETVVADYFAHAAAERLAAGEPAFLYGHPERRLGRMPAVLRGLSEVLERHPLAWRVTLTEFARWWHWRGALRWSVVVAEGDRYEIRVENWSSAFPISIELEGGAHVACLPLHGPTTPVPRSGLCYERRAVRRDQAAALRLPAPFGLRPWLKAALDWETVTPVEEIDPTDWRARAKRQLRRWRSAVGHGTGAPR